MITANVSILLTAMLFAQAKPSPPVRDSLYKRVMTTAVNQVHGEILRTSDFWVDHSRWEDPWIVETAHYEVRTVESAFLAADIARNLEYMRDEFVKVLGTGVEPKHKFRVWIFPNLPAYNDFSVKNGADEHSSMYGGYHLAQHADQPVVTYFIPNRVLLGMWITHGAAHQFIEQSFAVHPPFFVSEALASYFALFWDWSYGVRELQRIEASGYIPLAQVMQEPITAYTTGSEVRFIELGMFFNYLLNFRDDTKTTVSDTGETAPMRDLLRTMMRGGGGQNSPTHRLLTQDLARVEQDFKAFDFKVE